jgi:hypothetical protein
MNDENFERLMKDAAETYNRPPKAPLDEMWSSIESEAFGTRLQVKRRYTLMANPWLRMAAVLVLGVAIGRGSMLFQNAAPAPAAKAIAVSAQESADSYQLTTDRYLGQTMALLVDMPKQLQSGHADTAFIARANKSLTTLRLLMDSPAASNPRLRSLFEDLELVLIQVVQMPRGGSATDASLIRQAMQQRDVMPRLRDAVAETPNN